MMTRDAHTSDEAARDLIARADAHPLGREFLREGALDAVAATFHVHAFAVDRARELMNADGDEAAARAAG